MREPLPVGELQYFDNIDKQNFYKISHDSITEPPPSTSKHAKLFPHFLVNTFLKFLEDS